MQIASVEDAIIAKVKAAFPNGVLRSVDSLPADFDPDTLKRLLRVTPGVFVVFDGGPAIDASTVPGINAQFSVIAVTSHASGEKARRRGDSQQIGAYDILETLIPQLHRLIVPAIGSLKFSGLENRYDGVLDSQGVAVYAASFVLTLSFDPVPFEQLVPFTGVDVTTTQPSIDDTPAAVDHVDLPQS